MIEILEVTTPADRAAAFAIRRLVFCREQGIDEAAEFDLHDDTATHLLARLDARPVGTLRWRLAGEQGAVRIERVAVLADARRRGVADAMLGSLLAQLAVQGVSQCWLHAQTTAIALYERHGFIAEGDPYLEDGILHRTMRRLVGESGRQAQTGR